jgi:AmmeMemoRadiSam system protein A
MLNLARTALVNLTIGASEPELNEAPPWLEQPGACFVTLHKGAALRGCIGQVNVSGPLWRAIVRNAQGAARRDPRFAPLEAPELDRVKIEISVLTRPQRLAFASEAELLSQLRPHQHGVLLELEGCTATFLPQVWEQVPDKIDFLNRLTQKAGFPSGSWHRRDVSISVYQVEHFEEP